MGEGGRQGVAGINHGSNGAAIYADDCIQIAVAAGDVLAAALAALWWGLRQREPQRWPFVLAGVLAGADQYTYTGSRLLPMLVLAWLGWLALADKERLRQHAGGLLAMGLVFAVVAAPLYQYALRHPHEWNARVNQTGIIQSGWLANERLHPAGLHHGK